MSRSRLEGDRRGGGNAGFSLIEMVLAVAILTFLSGMIFLGTGSFRRKETDRFSRELCNQIRLTRTVAMSKTGYWRLCLYLKDGDYYCVQERGTKEAGGEIVWEAKSDTAGLGHEGAVTYTRTDNQDTDQTQETKAGEDSGELIAAWRFDRDTGSCIKGAGTLELVGQGKTKTITVYRENGYCIED